MQLVEDLYATNFAASPALRNNLAKIYEHTADSEKAQMY